MTLRGRLLVSIVLTLLLSLLSGAALTYFHAIQKIETEMQAAIAVGGRIAHNAVDDVDEASNPLRRLQLLIADFDGDRHLRASHVIGGKVVQSSQPARNANDLPEWFARFFIGQPYTASVELPKIFDGYGSIILETDARNEVGEVWNDIGVTLIVLTIFFSLVLTIVYSTIGHALRPLRSLTAAIHRVGNSDYGQRVAEQGPIELALLCQGFNQMVERLAKAESQNKRLQEQLATVQEEERADLARDLHDEIGPMLFAVDVDAVAIRELTETGQPDQVRARVGFIRDAVGHMQRQVKKILGRLRPAVLLDVGLAHAIDNLLSFWRGRHPNIAFTVDLPPEGFGEPLDGTIYRVVQESLSNAVRHGRPTSIDITIRQTAEDGTTIEIADNGSGMIGTGQSGGFGITGMRERIEFLGGSLEVRNRVDSAGVLVGAKFPHLKPPPPSKQAIAA